jgi:hypothetical protein
MEFEQIDITGCRLVGALTKLGHIGPKHHGIVVGHCSDDDKVYVADQKLQGHRLITYDDFIELYSGNADIRIIPNDGDFTDYEVAQRALDEITGSGSANYNLVTNNCESFSNRAMYDHSLSSQVINTIAATALFIGGVWLISRNKMK